ncbi:MAG: DUF4293 domain-containing protein [Bacteroidota bacterium]
MIQRIQTLFLLLAAAAAFALFAFPFASTAQAVESSAMFADGLYDISDSLGLQILFCLAGILAFVSMLLFKNRKTQLLVSRMAIVANVIGLVLAIMLFVRDRDTLGPANPDDGLGLYLPILFLVFVLLAIRFINKDEKLVRSMDRLR